MAEFRQFDRGMLIEALDRYLAALVDRNPGQLEWSNKARASENNVELDIGDGLWGTVSGLGAYRLAAADCATGQVCFFGVVEETLASSLFALRLRVTRKGKIAEAESLVHRRDDEGIPFPEPKLVEKPIFDELLPEEQRRPRERLISIANGYFDTLQLNDGALFTEFHDDCERVENGFRTTNNPEYGLTPIGALPCAEQFKLGNYRYDDRLRARRYPLVDVERGLVFASAFIDHTGRLGSYRLTDGRVVDSPVRRPHSFYLLELFKIVGGKLKQIEAVFMTVPYHMPSPWSR